MKKKMKGLIFPFIGFFGGCLIVEHRVIKSLSIELTKQRNLSDKHFELYMLMKNWVKLKQKGVNLSSYFLRKGYKRIAIYGMNYVGRILVDELKNSGLEIVRGIDKNSDAVNSDIKVVVPDNFDDQVDAIVVTPISFYNEICEEMEKRITCPIISLKNIVFELTQGR